MKKWDHWADVYLDELQAVDQNPWKRVRKKMEYYMHENLSQVKWIFVLILVVKIGGFITIVFEGVLAFFG